MESLNKAMAQAKRPKSLQNLLREQMDKIRGQGSGGNGGNKTDLEVVVMVLMAQRMTLSRIRYMR